MKAHTIMADEFKLMAETAHPVGNSALEDGVDFEDAGKLKSMGLMAGVIAHDFNNILTAIQGHLEMLNLKLSAGDDPSQHIAEMRVAIERGGEMIHELLSRASDRQFTKAQVKPAELIGDVVRLTAIRVPESVQLSRSFELDLPALSANPTQLRQAVMNLVLNAIEAMDEDGGNIRVSATLCSPDHLRSGTMINSYNGAAECECVCVSVTDTGVGMDEELITRSFDPFYTTKETGNGLGLAAVKKIVENHSGALHVHSMPGDGTCISMYLPLSD